MGGCTITVAAFAAAAVLLVAFIVFELRSRVPMLDLALFRRPSFTTLMVGGAVFQGAVFGYVISVSLWAQSLLGMSAIEAGLALTPLAGASFVVAVLVRRLLHNAPPQYLIGSGLLLIGVGVLLDTAVGADSDWRVLMPGLLLAASGRGPARPGWSGRWSRRRRPAPRAGPARSPPSPAARARPMPTAASTWCSRTRTVGCGGPSYAHTTTSGSKMSSRGPCFGDLAVITRLKSRTVSRSTQFGHS
ncbi:MAG TPA: hypothetical protein VFO16_04315 [Pseudonocardiaceae bacterium]|nr:hypothetical protein [Pseudonocardiaceae bacterium]